MDQLPAGQCSGACHANPCAMTEAARTCEENIAIAHDDDANLRDSGSSDFRKSPGDDIKGAPPLNAPTAAAASDSTVTSGASKEVLMAHGGASEQLRLLLALLGEGRLQPADASLAIFNVLVGGRFELESNFVLKDVALKEVLNIMQSLSEKLQAEIWSVLSGLLRKSRRNQVIAAEAGITEYILQRLPSMQAGAVADLMLDALDITATYSITASELTKLFANIAGPPLCNIAGLNTIGCWPPHAQKLLQILSGLPTRHGPDEFFSFSGQPGAAIALPPASASKWPYLYGWTFSTWLYLDPQTSLSVDQGQPYIYCFQTKQEVGYSARFLGSVLVITSNKSKGKGQQHCVQYSFEPRKWYMVTIVHIYSRWRSATVKCYIDGNFVSGGELAWPISPSEPLDKCYFGNAADLSAKHSFRGQMAALYIFGEALEPAVISAIHQLGPDYKSHFEFENECSHVPDKCKKMIYDGKLTSSIVLMYSPAACDSLVCLESSPRGNLSVFVHSPAHGVMMEGVMAVVTHSVLSALHSIGGIQMMYPFFGQLAYGEVSSCSRLSTAECASPLNMRHDAGTAIIQSPGLCSLLMSFLCDMVESSIFVLQQLAITRGFHIISYHLEKAASNHLTVEVLGCFVRLVNYISKVPNGGLLFKQLHDHVIFNYTLWSRAPVEVQVALYEYTATDYLSVSSVRQLFSSTCNRTRAVVLVLHGLKHTYSLVAAKRRPKGRECDCSSSTGADSCVTATAKDIVRLRGCLLLFIDRLISRCGVGILDVEMEAIVNYLTVVEEEDDLFDVLYMCVSFVKDYSSSAVQAFDAAGGIQVVFKLLQGCSAASEPMRLLSLKLLGCFLASSTAKRKQEAVLAYNLLDLLTETLLSKTSTVTLALYNVLIEVLIEKIDKHLVVPQKHELDGSYNIQNMGLLKVIAELIARSEQTEECLGIRDVFLRDLLMLCQDNVHNRRCILQTPLWQDWLFSLLYVYPCNNRQTVVTSLVLDLCHSLIMHAVKSEHGGWCVWIDTMALLHYKVCREDYKIYAAVWEASNDPLRKGERLPHQGGGPSKASGDSPPVDASAPSEPCTSCPRFRITDFHWSLLHQYLLADLIGFIEKEVWSWREHHEKLLTSWVNDKENAAFVVNSIHLICHLSDVLISASGGLLPLLSAATSSTGEIDVLEPGYGLTLQDAVAYLLRVCLIADVLVTGSSVPLIELEAEKNMKRGAMVRQCLRMVCACAVRNCLECVWLERGSAEPLEPLSLRNGGGRHPNPVLALVEGVRALTTSEIYAANGGMALIDDELLAVQEHDTARLRAVLDRCLDEDSKVAERLALAVVFFVSSIMVAKYKRLLTSLELSPPIKDCSLYDAPAPEVVPCQQLVTGENVKAALTAQPEIQGAASATAAFSLLSCEQQNPGRQDDTANNSPYVAPLTDARAVDDAMLAGDDNETGHGSSHGICDHHDVERGFEAADGGCSLPRSSMVSVVANTSVERPGDSVIYSSPRRDCFVQIDSSGLPSHVANEYTQRSHQEIASQSTHGKSVVLIRSPTASESAAVPCLLELTRDGADLGASPHFYAMPTEKDVGAVVFKTCRGSSCEDANNDIDMSHRCSNTIEQAVTSHNQGSAEVDREGDKEVMPEVVSNVSTVTQTDMPYGTPAAAIMQHSGLADACSLDEAVGGKETMRYGEDPRPSGVPWEEIEPVRCGEAAEKHLLPCSDVESGQCCKHAEEKQSPVPDAAKFGHCHEVRTSQRYDIVEEEQLLPADRADFDGLKEVRRDEQALLADIVQPDSHDKSAEEGELPPLSDKVESNQLLVGPSNQPVAAAGREDTVHTGRGQTSGESVGMTVPRFEAEVEVALGTIAGESPDAQYDVMAACAPADVTVTAGEISSKGLCWHVCDEYKGASKDSDACKSTGSLCAPPVICSSYPDSTVQTEQRKTGNATMELLSDKQYDLSPLQTGTSGEGMTAAPHDFYADESNGINRTSALYVNSYISREDGPGCDKEGSGPFNVTSDNHADGEVCDHKQPEVKIVHVPPALSEFHSHAIGGIGSDQQSSDVEDVCYSFEPSDSAGNCLKMVEGDRNLRSVPDSIRTDVPSAAVQQPTAEQPTAEQITVSELSPALPTAGPTSLTSSSDGEPASLKNGKQDSEWPAVSVYGIRVTQADGSRATSTSSGSCISPNSRLLHADSNGSDESQGYLWDSVKANTVADDSGLVDGTNAATDSDNMLSVALERSLRFAAPYLKEVILDFLPFLTRHLLGSKGQTLLVSASLATVRDSQSLSATTATTELVMMLCSREWQVALQKHAALAFIELVNEGRLLSHAMRCHFVKVAKEGEAILMRLQAQDSTKHAAFKSVCEETKQRMMKDEKACTSLLSSARMRDKVMACRFSDKLERCLRKQCGALPIRRRSASGGLAAAAASPPDAASDKAMFWRLESWEDDCRRRRRFVPNPRGSCHEAAALPAFKQDGSPAATLVCGHNELPTLATPKQEANDGKALPTQASHSGGSDQTEEQEPDVDHAGSVTFATACKLISRGLVIRGTLSIGRAELFFEMDDDSEENKSLNHEVLAYVEYARGHWHFAEICAVASRRYLLQNVAVEVFFSSRSSALFAFDMGQKVVKQVVNLLPRVGPGHCYGLPCARRMSLTAPSHLFKVSDMMQRWRQREISNFEYIMFLNTIAGRSYNDLNQYPIFPWVLSNYESKELDLSQPSNYRDLSKPIGALNPLRRAFFEERYSSWEQTGGSTSPTSQAPPFHYGTHYSTAAYVLNWLVRVEPFTTASISLHDGKFDHANRIFSSIPAAWTSCQRDTADVKELIPEFYYLPEMFVNNNRLQLGQLEDGSSVGDVVLPPWADGPSHFVHICRQALESEIVSCQLHEWIDLIFGYKQKGPEAVRCGNVFYYLTYEGSVDLNSCKDAVTREAVENQIRSFGQTPAQLLTEPHPPRGSVMHVAPRMFAPVRNDICMSAKFLTSSPIIHLTANTRPQPHHSATLAVVCLFQNRSFAVNKWIPDPSAAVTSLPSNAIVRGMSPRARIGEDKSSSQSQPVQAPPVFLPLELDPVLSATGSESKRILGDNFDERLHFGRDSICVSQDSQCIVMCGFWDKSFRVYSAATGKAIQAIFGHYNIVSCVSLSEAEGYMGQASVAASCRPTSYLVTGSWDCTCFVWLWSSLPEHQQMTQPQQHRVLTAADATLHQLPTDGSLNPTPLVVLHGHRAALLSCRVSAELGLVASLSKDGSCLVHTLAADLLHIINLGAQDATTGVLPHSYPSHWLPSSLLLIKENYSLLMYGSTRMQSFSLSTGKLLRQHDLDKELSIQCAVASHDGLYLIIGGVSSKPQGSGFVHIVRCHDLVMLHRYPPCSTAVHDVALSHNRKYVLAGIGCGAIVVYNVDLSRWHHDYRRQ